MESPALDAREAVAADPYGRGQQQERAEYGEPYVAQRDAFQIEGCDDGAGAENQQYVGYV